MDKSGKNDCLNSYQSSSEGVKNTKKTSIHWTVLL